MRLLLNNPLIRLPLAAFVFLVCVFVCRADKQPSHEIYRVTLSTNLASFLWSSQTDGVTVERGEQGETVLQLDRNVSNDRCTILPFVVPLDPDKAYRISFEARTEGPDTLTKRPNLANLLMGAGPEYRVPQWSSFVNYSTNNPPVPSMRSFMASPLRHWRAVLHEEWTPYRDEFYVLDGAESISLNFNSSPKNRLWVKNIRLEEIDVSKVINLNYDFSAGPFCPINMRGGASYRALPEGGYAIHAGFVYCGPIPVREGDKLLVSIKANTPEPRANLEFFDVARERVKTLSVVDPYELVVPPSARYLGIGLPMRSWLEYESVKIERIEASAK